MSSQTVGGLHLRSFEFNSIPKGLQTLGVDPYQYRMASLSQGDTIEIEGGMAHCLHLYVRSSNHVEVIVGGQRASQNQTVWFKSDQKTEVRCEKGDCLLLLGSQKINVARSTEVRVFSENEVKKVTKPWGYELWLTGDPSPHFAFKRIFIKAGTKTSLQYHVHKRETNFLLEGRAGLHYNPDVSVPADQFQPSNSSTIALDPLSVIDVFPNQIHRLEAISDILLCEVSTPELDDVVRISDDSGRKDGRIESEHRK